MSKVRKARQSCFVVGREIQMFGHIKNCKFFEVCSAMMHVIIVGFSGAIAMNLTICVKQIRKQRSRQVVVITT